MKNHYAVAMTLTQHKEAGKINIQTILICTDAVSKEEAIGIAMADARKAQPDHTVHSEVCLCVGEGLR